MNSKSSCTAFLDSNVLFSAAMRDIFMELALAKLFRARWSADVHREWIEAVIRRRPRLSRTKLERTRDLMNAAIPSASVTGYGDLIESISLPEDPHDRHVVAAAVAGECDVIVTSNLRHFPKSALAPFDIAAQRPDTFLADHLELNPATFCAAVRTARITKKNPPYTVEAQLSNLHRIGLRDTVTRLRQHADLLE